MRILQTLNWTQFAGTEKVCVDLSNELAKNNEVILLSSKDITKYLNCDVRFILFDFAKNRYNPYFLYKTAKLIEKISPDVIHCHNGKELEIIRFMQIFLHKKIPILATRHCIAFKKQYMLADIGVAVSSETMANMNSKKNILITNGIGFKSPNFIKKDNKFTILGVGRLVEAKGWDLLITALSKVEFDFKLQILGEGNEKENLQSLAANLGISEKIELVGFVENVADYVYSCDLQVIASQTEGLSISLIEAIFYAKVLIASDIANHKDILGDELVFDRKVENLTKKLNEIYANYDKFTEIFSKVKARKDDFSIEKMAQKYMDAYCILSSNQG